MLAVDQLSRWAFRRSRASRISLSNRASPSGPAGSLIAGELGGATTAAGAARFEAVSVVEEQFPDQKLKAQRFEQTRLGDAGELRLVRKSRQQTDEAGALTDLAFLPTATKVRMPEIGAVVDIDAFDIQPQAHVGSYTYRFPGSGHVETGTLSDVGPDASGIYWFSYGDALGYYSGEADVKDAQGKLLFHKPRAIAGLND